MWLHIENSSRDGITHLPRQKQFCFLGSTLIKHMCIFLLKETWKLTFKGFFNLLIVCVHACMQACWRTCTVALAWESEDNFLLSVICFLWISGMEPRPSVL